MATEVSRTFDLQHGCIVLNVRDEFGTVTPHTVYVTGITDIDQHVQRLLAEVDAQAAALRAAMISAGWKP